MFLFPINNNPFYYRIFNNLTVFFFLSFFLCVIFDGILIFFFVLLLLFYSISAQCNILSRFPCAFLHNLPLFLFHCIVKPFLLIFTILFICHFVPHIYKKKPSLKFSTKLFPYYYYCVCVGIKNNKKRKTASRL